MSISKKNNKKNKSTQKNYKIESLEPRFLMDAASDESYKLWNDELACVTAHEYWLSDSSWKKNDSVNTVIDGLYRKSDSTGDLTSGQISDLWEYGASKTPFSVAQSNLILDCVQQDLSKKMKNISKGSVITASNLKKAIDGNSFYIKLADYNGVKEEISYAVKSTKNNIITIDVSAKTVSSWSLDSKVNYRLSGGGCPGSQPVGAFRRGQRGRQRPL